jgi:sugar-specific transcriptional regulator TrmB
MEKNRMIEDNHVQALMDFGLSFLQAKIYLNLVKLEKASVKSIAQTSKVARQDIYRLMPILMKVGLAEKIIGRPTIYKATPLKLGLSILFQKKKQECAELGNKEKWLLNIFPLCSSQNDLEEDNYNFRITYESTPLLKLLRKLIQKAHETIDVIIPSITKPWKLS